MISKLKNNKLQYQLVENYFSDNYTNLAKKEEIKKGLQTVVHSLGPVVDTYPIWHPAVTYRDPFEKSPIYGTHESMIPNKSNGYSGLDHTRFFVKGFITCPYNDGEEIINSVENLSTGLLRLNVRKLDIELYNPNCTPIMVEYNWARLDKDGMIPFFIAMPLLLKQELPSWGESEIAETWETMHTYFLGRSNERSSELFVSKKTEHLMKNFWNGLLDTGLFGKINK